MWQTIAVSVNMKQSQTETLLVRNESRSGKNKGEIVSCYNNDRVHDPV